nr:hypothetical protein [Desulfofalx alkaliphila]
MWLYNSYQTDRAARHAVVYLATTNNPSHAEIIARNHLKNTTVASQIKEVRVYWNGQQPTARASIEMATFFPGAAKLLNPKSPKWSGKVTITKEAVAPGKNDDQPIIQLKTTAKTRFVRNNIVTAISPGGGKGNTTLLTSLATAAAINIPNRRPVAILDLAEFPKVPTVYGISCLEMLENPDILWPSISTWDESTGYSIDEYTIKHPDLGNLYIVPGVIVATIIMN